MIPILYEIDEQNFVHNGLGMLPNVVDSYAYEVANAEYEMYLEYPTTEWIDGYENKIWRELKIYERQILYKPSHSRDPHAFRIYDYEIDSVAQVIKVWAKSRAYDLAGNMVKKVEINSLTPEAAMTLMAANLLEPTDFTFYSNMTTTTSSVDWEQRSGLSCIMGQAGSLIQYWGGEVLRENKRISLYNRVGRDNVTTLRVGKNIEQLNYQLDTNNLVTAIVPYYMQRDEVTNEETLIYGDTVKSGKFANYRLPYYQFVEYREEDGVADLATLNAKAATWFNEHKGQDEPNLTIDVDMTDVAESSEYAAILKQLEQVNVFDTVTVYVGEFDIDLEIKVASLKYDGVNERNLGVTLGKPTSSLFETYITPQFTDLKNQLDAVRQIGIAAMTSADGKNTNYHGSVDPNVAGLVGVDNDLFFQQDGTAQRMWRWGSGQWNVVEYKADWLTGTIDAATLNVINVNAANIVGYNADLITASLHAANSNMYLDGTGLKVINSDTLDEAIVNNLGEFRSDSGASGNYALLGNGRAQFYGDTVGSLFYLGAGLAVNDRNKAGIYLTHRQDFSIYRYNDYSSNPLAVPIPFLTTEYEVNDTTYNELLGIVRIHRQLVLNDNISFRGEWRNINGANKLSFQYGGYVESLPSSDMQIVASSKLFADVAGSRAVQIDSGYMYLTRHLSMEGNNITNQSDIRLKTNVVDSTLGAVDEVATWRFIDFDWDKSNPVNANKPEERQFGIEAQSAAAIQTKTEASESYLSVNMTKQVNITAKAIQELAAENQALKQEIAELKDLLISKKII